MKPLQSLLVIVNFSQFLSGPSAGLLDMVQTVRRSATAAEPGLQRRTTRCLIRNDVKLLANDRRAPHIGEHTAALRRQIGLFGGTE